MSQKLRFRTFPAAFKEDVVNRIESGDGMHFPFRHSRSLHSYFQLAEVDGPIVREWGIARLAVC